MVSLMVSDGTLANTATVSITTINQAPVANAGAGQSVNGRCPEWKRKL